VIGLLVKAGCNQAIGYYRGVPIYGVWDDVSRGDVMMISAPFAVLTLLGIRSVLAWAAGISATVAFWGFVYLPHALEEGGGVNLGFAFLLPFSPIFVLSVALLGLLPQASRDDR
jgi:hypothetical protein